MPVMMLMPSSWYRYTVNRMNRSIRPMGRWPRKMWRSILLSRSSIDRGRTRGIRSPLLSKRTGIVITGGTVNAIG
ncbi:MAG: hypothetical protein NTV10_00430 [Methanoregula sp.]|nr:hypothetical protein [Methanoregula sp.]